ncbi:hypothetical protein [Streptomyces sp. NPDC126933]|uniref:hypothetical protein n=1 Tax=unclassified Streptomyces TaxID=2593676 RepID=UPI003650DBDA
MWQVAGKRAEKGKSADVDEEITRLRRENAALKKDTKEPAMERAVLKRCMVRWVK